MRSFFIAACAAVVVLSSLTAHAQDSRAWRKAYRGIAVGKPLPSKLTLPYNDHTKMIICNNRPIPPNWIIVGVRHAANCNGLGNNAWVIQKLPSTPGMDMIICGNQPVPPGWVIIERVHTDYCGHGTSGLRIRKE
ncbi:MAG TPA: hypothetical protein VNQ76_16760 [Planctomicrobium sp.]|nr:hypothetical protein [Planctomicrobium sp.]